MNVRDTVIKMGQNEVYTCNIYYTSMRCFVLWTVISIFSVPTAVLFFALKMYVWSLVSAAIAAVLRVDSVRSVIRASAVGKGPYISGSPDISDRRLMALFKCNPTVVGSAWGFFLQRRSAKGPVLSLRNYTGVRHEKDGDWWAAGTTIRKVCDYYIREGRTLSSHPSIDSITIGAWVATGSHGNGSSGNSSSSAIHSVKVVRCHPRSTLTVSYAKMRRMIDHQPHYIVTWVKFHNLVENMWLQKDGFTINSIDTAKRWLRTGAMLRVLFVGAARDGLGIRWEKPRVGLVTDHIDPHCCSKYATFVQADICSAVCGWRESDSEWQGLTTLRDANQWSPTIYPIETLIAVIGGIKNFELVFRMDVDAQILYKMCNKLRNMHRKIGGRTEIRYGKEVVFWDLSLRRSFVEPVKLLSEFGVDQVALHPGKYDPRTVHNGRFEKWMKFVKIGDIYNPIKKNINF